MPRSRGRSLQMESTPAQKPNDFNGRFPDRHSAFRSVVFAQVRISALNTALTALYLLIIVPWMGIHLPLTKTMIAVHLHCGASARDRQPHLEHRDRGRELERVAPARRELTGV